MPALIRRRYRHRPMPGAGTLRRLGAAMLTAVLFAGCAPQAPQSWALTDIKGYLPDLQLHLKGADQQLVTARELRGKIVLLYFGYAHCPDICPMTMGRLTNAMKALGDQSRDLRIVFVSVDPFRDTPELIGQYAQAFSPQAIGLTGPADEIEQLAKRYRVAYQAEKPDGNDNYAVMHSKAVYVFDRQGRARLMGTDTDTSAAFTHDLRQLVAESP